MSSSSVPYYRPLRKTRLERLGDALYGNKILVLFGLLAAIAVNVLYWLVSNVSNIDFGWKGGPWIESTTIAAEIGLALGTIALAAAAFLQARAADIQLEVASRQEQREEAQANAAIALTRAAEHQAKLIREQLRVQTRPSLAVQFRGLSLQFDTPEEIRVLSPGDLFEVKSVQGAVYAYNAGPGVAWDVSVEVRGLSPTDHFADGVRAKGVGCAPMIGPDNESQVSFPGPILGELWPSLAVGPKSVLIVTIEAVPGSTEEPLESEDLRFTACGGLILEEVTQAETRQADVAWRILTDGECRQLSEETITPNDIPGSLGSSGRRTIQFNRTLGRAS